MKSKKELRRERAKMKTRGTGLNVFPRKELEANFPKVKPSKTLFTLKEVNKTFPGRKQDVKALHEVKMEIPRQGITGIVGESGSGKTTLLRLLGGIYQPDTSPSGTVHYHYPNGSEINLARVAEGVVNGYRGSQIGWIFQDLNLFAHLNAWRNVAVPLFLQGCSWKKAESRARERLSNMNVRETAMPRELSGGEQQRIAVARALVVNPQVILADEPTGNLDKKNTDDILRLLKHMNEERGTSVIIITHDTAIAKEYCSAVFRCTKTEKGGVVEMIRTAQGG